MPELLRARERRIAPLPPGPFRLSVFDRESFTEKLLGDELALLVWYRRQLAADWPAVPEPTRAGLVLVFAARAYVLATADLRSPVGLFVRLVAHGRWHKLRTTIGPARRCLAELVARYGEAILSGDEQELWAAAAALGAADNGAGPLFRPTQDRSRAAAPAG
jgi:hypothetical protein